MSKNKIYCGSGKVQTDTWFKVTINPDKIADYVQEYNGNRFVKLNINIKPEPDKYGKDIEITVDTWQPKKEVEEAPGRVEGPYVAPEDTDNDDLPF